MWLFLRLHNILDNLAFEGSKRFLLIVDEMQRLVPAQFNAYAELHDLLRLQKIHLAVIFVANKQESNNLIELTEKDCFSHIKGRFFKNKFNFSGLKTVEEIEFCLQQYDNVLNSEYRQPFTQYFLPEAYSKGWRLKSLGKRLFYHFTERQSFINENQIGMEDFISVINTLLIDYLSEYGVDNHVEDMIIKSMEARSV